MALLKTNRQLYDEMEPSYDDNGFGPEDEPMMDGTAEALWLEADALEKRARAETAAGVADFFGVIAGVAVILLLLTILISLLNWLWKDAGDAFMMLINLI